MMILNSDLSQHDLLPKIETSEKPSIELIIGINQKQFDSDNPNIQFFVKFKNRKYADCVWIKKQELESIPDFYPNFIEPFLLLLKESRLLPVPFISSLYKPENIPFDESFLYPEQVLYKKKEKGEKYYLVKWKNLGVDQSTWEDNSDGCIPMELIKEYKISKKKSNQICTNGYEVFQNPDQFIPLFDSPVYKNDNRLTTFQLDGLNWLIDKWYNNRNSIQADEPGSGKKVQCIAFTEEINRLIGCFGPYLIITSISNVKKWTAEFNKWTDLRILEYIGNEKQLQILYNYALFTDDTKKLIKYDVIITTLDILSSKYDNFCNIRWICTYIDNLIPRYLQNPYLDKIDKMSDHLIILTYEDITTLPIKSVYSIFHILENDTYSDLESFIQLYSNPNLNVNIANFGQLNVAHILRRSKNPFDPFNSNYRKKQDWCDENEVNIYAEQTPIQLDIYRNFFIEQRSSFIFNDNIQHNLFMLRKIANHPLLIQSEFKKFKKEVKSEEEEVKKIVDSSGKMIVLDKLLAKFQSMNNRVLILSNMKEMVNLIELYLQKKHYTYKRLDGSNGEVNNSQFQNGDFVFLSSISNFQYDYSETDTAIIYDSHFTPVSLFDKKIYRLFTRGTIEEDLFNKFIIEKDFSAQSKEDINFLMRKNAYFAFCGQIDQSFFFEPIEKTIDYRTDFNLKSPEELSDHDFWINLFKKLDLKKLEEISIDDDQLRSIARLIINVGCFETHNQIQNESENKFILVSLVYTMYKMIPKEKRIIFKFYIQKVKRISKEIIVSKEVISREPLNNEHFIHDLFGIDLYSTMLKIFSIDRIYTSLSFISMNKINQIGFIFGRSMNVPVYWNDYYDYTLLYTSFMHGINQSNVKIFQRNLESIKILVGSIPNTSGDQPNLPNVSWLKARISLLVSEIELFIDDDYYPSKSPLMPIDWVEFYRPSPLIHLETKSMVKRVIRFLYLYGFPSKQANISNLKVKLMLDPIPDEIITVIIYSIIKSAADLLINNKEKRRLTNFETENSLYKSKEISRSMHDVLISLIKDLRPIRVIDLSWVKKDALFFLAEQLIFFVRIRCLYENISRNRIPYIGHPRWNGAPKWWNYESNIEFIHVVASYGFTYLSCLKSLAEIKAKLTKQDIEEIKNFRIYEKKMLGDVRIELPKSLSELSFLRKIESRLSILQKLMTFLSIPPIKTIANFLPLNQMAGLIVINFGIKNNSGYPMGYYSIRFYRGTQKNDTSEGQINSPFSDKLSMTDAGYSIYSFFCILKEGPGGHPLFIIRNQDENLNKMFEVGHYSLNSAYEMFLNTLISKGIERPPPYFDGYEFFGFKNKFVRSFITTS